MIENQISVSNWADETFGPAGSNARVAARSNEEMAELLRALTADDNHPKAAEEVADIVIVLYRLATRLGVDLHDEIDRKMAINCFYSGTHFPYTSAVVGVTVLPG